MIIDILINGNNNLNTNYVTWTPANCQIMVTDPQGAINPIRVKLKNQNTNQGGQLVFFDLIPGNEQDELQFDLPVDGTPVDFFIAGKFQYQSEEDRDAVIEVLDANSGNGLYEIPLMVRIRKNANELTNEERFRFISALATLNDRGMGQFTEFRNTHTNAGELEAHGDSGFLPWHRAYLLDLERELQRIDPSVTLPYWKFDEPAPNLFTRDFMGVSPNGRVDFADSNPLFFWTTDGGVGIVRYVFFNSRTSAPLLYDEEKTMLIGERFELFQEMEQNPHNRAHTGFGPFLSDFSTAVRDPLFFLLHANVDRLWAKWQWYYRRFDITKPETFHRLGRAGNPGSTRVGHNLQDTMWPWNGITGATDRDRPINAPGGNLAQSLITNAPGPSPRVGDLIDYRGVMNRNNYLGFDYDDIPFEFNNS